jgi:hypothetical protein
MHFIPLDAQFNFKQTLSLIFVFVSEYWFVIKNWIKAHAQKTNLVLGLPHSSRQNM